MDVNNNSNEVLVSVCINVMDQKKAFVKGLFSFLDGKKYAMIKTPQLKNKKESFQAELEICLSKDLLNDLNRGFLSSIESVKKISKKTTSKMRSIIIEFQEGSSISIDFIWKLKVKSIEIMSIKKVISYSTINHKGQRVMSAQDNARFVGLFFILNRQSIPSSYSYYSELLNSSNNRIDRLLYPHFVDDSSSKRGLLHYLKGQKQNLMLWGLRNKINFLMDSLKVSRFDLVVRA